MPAVEKVTDERDVKLEEFACVEISILVHLDPQDRLANPASMEKMEIVVFLVYQVCLA